MAEKIMGKFDRGNRGGFGGGRGGFGGRDSRGGGFRDRGGFGGGRDRRSSEKFEAICAECNKTCEVPFRPTGDKPVYCSDCFEKKGGRPSFGGASRNDFRGDRRSAPSFGGNRGGDDNKKQFEAINIKLDKLTKIVESLISVKKSEDVKDAIVHAVKVEAKSKVKKVIKKKTSKK